MVATIIFSVPGGCNLQATQFGTCIQDAGVVAVPSLPVRVNGRTIKCAGVQEDPVNHRCSLFALLIVAVLQACSSAPPRPVAAPDPRLATRNLGEARKVVGNESGIMVNAEIYNSAQIDASSTVIVVCEIENRRHESIAIADIIPVSTYDAESRTITVQLGSEVPGTQLVPRLLEVKPGETRKLTLGAHMNVQIPHLGPMLAIPRELQVKVNFLGDARPFAKLVDIPEKAVHDPDLANELFAKWVEGNEAVLTNAVPVHWSLLPVDSAAANMSADTGGSKH